MSLKIHVGDLSEGDLERAVLPTIIYMSKRNDTHRGYALSLGWWRWGIQAIFIRQLAHKTNGGK